MSITAVTIYGLTIGPGPALDRLVAERVGWRIEKRPPWSITRQGKDYPCTPEWRIVTPDGRDYFIARGDVAATVDKAWEEALAVDELIPHYSTDLNAAFALFQCDPITHVPLEWNLFSDSCDDFTCEVGHWALDPSDKDWFTSGNAKTPIMAIVEAWLRWGDQMPDHERYPKG